MNFFTSRRHVADNRQEDDITILFVGKGLEWVGKFIIKQSSRETNAIITAEAAQQ